MSDRPNIIMILTDDHGYGDLSCMGATDFRTPHLDRLADAGVRFTNWYANAPVCSPTRASYLTGRYPGNAGVRSILAGHRTATGLPPQVPTIATALKAEGYRTAMFGKWHLGLTPGSRPNDHGFDEFFGFLAGCVDFFSHIFYWGMNKPGPGVNPTHDLWHNEQEAWHNGEYLTDMLTSRGVDYIRESAGRDEPFFLYMAYNAPHYPMHAPRKYMDRFAHLPWDRQVMAAMISAVDDGVGELRAELERRDMLENTIIVFSSDNGPSRESRNWLDGNLDPYYGGTTGAPGECFKGHKFSLYDGGIRVPGIMSWPARIEAGRVLDTPAATMDTFPTLLAAAGADASRYELDGANLLPHLADGESLPERDIFFEQSGQLAVRRGKWKLVLGGRLVEGSPEEDAIHLADIQADPGESRNLKDAHPGVCADLKSTAEQWLAKIEDRWQSEFAKPNGTVAHK